MRTRTSSVAIALAGAACLVMSGCGTGSGSVYVGVSAPGPWYGYPYPGMYPRGGVWVGVPICCDDDMDAMAEPVESTERYADASQADEDDVEPVPPSGDAAADAERQGG